MYGSSLPSLVLQDVPHILQCQTKVETNGFILALNTFNIAISLKPLLTVLSF